MRQIIILFILLLLSSTLQADSRALYLKKYSNENKVALVIGNRNYTHFSKLKNSTNDAYDMQKILKDKGFDVLYLENANLRTMKKTLRKFTNKLRNSGVGLFYYAGHGIEVDGKNYLIPINANIPKKDEVEYEALAMNMVIDKMANAKNRLNLVILDACRNDPYSRSGDGGLAQINNAQGMYIAFATAPKSVASDGSGRNGLFTKHLIENIKKPNLELDRIFKNVRKGVKQESNGAQQPWTSSSVDGDFYFNAQTEIIQKNEKPNTFSLEINPTPSDAKIIITNRREKYRHGMYLKSGKYIIKVSKNGFLTKKLTINLRDNIYTNVKLEKEKLLFKKAIKTFRGHTSDVNSVAISPNGKYIVSGSYDDTIKLWDINTGELIRSFKGHKGDVNSVAISPNGKYIISGSSDKTIKLWGVLP